MEYIFSFDSSTFSQLTEPPMAHVSAAVGHYIFLIGGYRISYENDLRTIIAFDKHSILYYNVLNSHLDTIECSYDAASIGSFPTEFFCASGMACCSFDKRIYLFGGYSLSKQEAGNALYYIEITKEMTQSSQLDIRNVCNEKPTARLKFLAGSYDGINEEEHLKHPSYRDKSSIVYWDNHLIVFGGYGSNFRRTENQENDTGHNFLADHGEYISGSGNRGWTNQLLIFSLSDNQWRNPATFGVVPCPRAAHCAAVSGSRMFVFGGRLGMRNSAATVRSNQFFCLDLVTLHWSELVLSPTSSGVIGRSWTSLTTIAPDRFFIVGGFSGENVPLSDAYVVDARDRRNVVVTRKGPCFERASWDPFVDGNSWIKAERFSPVSRMWHSASLAPDGLLYVVGGCRNNLIFQVERIQATLERVRAEPLSLYELCLWNVVKLRLALTRPHVPNRLFDDLVRLSI